MDQCTLPNSKSLMNQHFLIIKKKKNTLSDKLIKPQSLPDPGRRYSTGEVSGVATIFVGFRSMTWTLLFLQKEIRFLSSDTTVCLHFQSPQL